MAARYGGALSGVEDGAKVEMKIAGTVVIYNADESVINNILSYYDIVEVLFVCDNSTIANERLLNRLYALPKVRAIPMGGNRGIAAALASGLRAARETGCDYCLTMDQDSIFPTDKTDIIKNYLSAPDADDYGIIGLDFNNPAEEHSLKEVKFLLTSGNFINMKNYAQINGFMEELFIDYVDFELDEQFFNLGKKLAYITGVSLVHTIGNPITKKFFGIKFTCMNHSPVRYYYRFRNALYLYRRNKKFYGERYRHDLFIDIPKVILFERDKLKKLKMIARGRRDARAGRLGEYKGSV